MIEIKNVSKRYGEKIVVSEVQLPITEQKLNSVYRAKWCW
jgi:iron complex transport system ATP-binding protein